MTSRGQVRFSYPAWRGYIFGVDVTNDMTACTLNWNDARTPNLCEIVLSSERDRYITTPTDIHAMYDDIKAEEIASSLQLIDVADFVNEATTGASEMSGRNIAARAARTLEREVFARLDRGRFAVDDVIKRSVLKAKVLERVKNVEQPGIAAGLENARIAGDRQTAAASASEGVVSAQKLAALSGEVLRFPFQVGQCIFHTGDPVRVFWRDPFNPNEWFFAITGFVSDWKESVGVNGERTVTITVEDPLRMYRHARIATNWALHDIAAVSDPTFDALVRTWHVDHFEGLSLPQILWLMTFGRENSGQDTRRAVPLDEGESINAVQSFNQYYYSVNGKTPMNMAGRQEGIGVFNIEGSSVFTLGPEGDTGLSLEGGGAFVTERIANLETWQANIDHAIPSSVQGLVDMALPDFEDDIRSRLEPAEDEGLLTPDVIMQELGENPHIYPVEHGRLLMLMPASLGPGSQLDVLLKELVQGLATRTEFVSRLQIIYNICERINFSFYATPKGDVVLEMPLYSFRPEDFGSYADRYIFSMHDTLEYSSHFSDEAIRTMMIMSWNIVQNLPSVANNERLWLQPGVVHLRALTPMFGIRPETMDPYGYISSEAAAAYYAHIKLSQINSNAWTQNISTVMRVGVGPNRPCYFEARDFISTLRGATSSIVWNNGVTQSLKLNYRRGWSGMLTKDGKHVYEAFGGRMTQPIDYPMLWQEDTNESGTSTKESERVENPTQQTPTKSNAEIEAKLRTKERYPPFSEAAYFLFEDAIRDHNASAGPNDQIPVEWARDPNLHNIIRQESGGYVGRPNYTYDGRAADPDQWDGVIAEIRKGMLTGRIVDAQGNRSGASGIGQLNRANAAQYYPSGLSGVGHADEEAIGMVRYIRARYGDPATAWSRYGRGQEGY